MLKMNLWLVVAVHALRQPVSGVIGGGEVIPGTFPFLVNRNHQCGGTLIAPDWVLTGAHCDMFVGEFVDLNRFDLSVQEPQAERIRIAEVHPYPDYNVSDLVNDLHDIKLVRLAQPVNHTKPARLVSSYEEQFLTRPGTLLTVAGWGAVVPCDLYGVGVSTLRAVQIPVIPNDLCKDKQHYGTIKPVYESMMCAGFEDGGKDACIGDSGGPLFAVLEGEGVIVGVISWALGCALPKRPGVYTRVANYRYWINYTMTVRNAFPYPSLPPINSCQGMCGNANAQTGCFCAPSCDRFEACCEDFQDVCVLGNSDSVLNNRSRLYAAEEVEWRRTRRKQARPKPSCSGVCGRRAMIGGESCACDEACVYQGDCCSDFEIQCRNKTCDQPPKRSSG